MVRLAINPPELKDARQIGYNHGIIAGGTFYMAGQVAMDADSEIVGDDIRTQAEKAYENVGYLLEAIDKSFDDIAKVTTHIVDAQEHYYDGYKEVYWETFDEPYPCHTVLGTDQLADEGYLVEIEIEVPLTDAEINAIEPDGTVVRKL
ncbi:Rid family hydrolase [Halostagnicola sp. A-GB9-2]|uniref:RidA family protein n=1 Tax=Halostagnicola sp. A-GB9-2 TaxID=3048066 RepID=UPI0024BF7B2B|nr:Rid family hydrolase [Halostagnicola sp. A-GB9-2]MDJ1434215.1 Rid family hydrolase [Halostagnicola sp. A-GB9-2]